MLIFLINIFITLILTIFTLGIYEDLPENAFFTIVIFLGWYIVAWLISYFYDREHFIKIPNVISLIVFYLKELFLASIKVAFDIITPKDYMNPAVIALPLDASSDLEITLLANLITLTPGTLSIDISKDRKTLYIHELYIKGGDLESKKREIKNGFERRILKITR